MPALVAEDLAPSEFALAALLVVCVIAALIRLARLASGRSLPPRFVAAVETMTLTPASDTRRRRLAVRAAFGAALGWGGALPYLARISLAWGGVLFCEDLMTRRLCGGGGCGHSGAEVLAWYLAFGLRHVVVGFSLGVGGTMAHAGLLTLARHVTTKHLGAAHVGAASRLDAHDAAILPTTTWYLTSFIGPVLTMTALMFSAVEFYPTYAMNVSVGPCAANTVVLRLIDDERVQRLDPQNRVLASASAAHVRRLVSSGEEDVELHVDDGFAHRAVIAVVDGLRADTWRSVCLPVMESPGAASPTDVR